MMTPPHLDTMLRGPAHRQEIGHDIGHQVSTHLYSGVKVILKQAAWQLHCFQLRNKEKRGQ